jgi:hypothetical protein
MRNILAWIIGAALAANGLFMLADPAAWYAAVPGVMLTGPLNPHFVRDIGGAYLVAGASLAAFAINPRARGAALAGSAFLTVHALVHLWDGASGRESLHHLANDLPAVFLPPAIALWLAWPSRIFQQEKQHAEMAGAAAHRRV